MANIGAPKRIIEVEPEKQPAPSQAPGRKDAPVPERTTPVKR